MILINHFSNLINDFIYLINIPFQFVNIIKNLKMFDFKILFNPLSVPSILHIHQYLQTSKTHRSTLSSTVLSIVSLLRLL